MRYLWVTYPGGYNKGGCINIIMHILNDGE